MNWTEIRKELPIEVQNRLDEKKAKRQTEKWIDLSVYNAFDNAKENGYDFIALGTSTKEIAVDMKDKDFFLESDSLEDIEAAIERYKTNFINKE